MSRLLFPGRRNKTERKYIGDSLSNSSSSISTAAMEHIVERLKMNKHRSTTKKTYYGVWKSFNKFILKLDRRPNNWEDKLVLFVAFLIENKRKSATIRSYISALRSVLADNGITLNKNRALLTSLTKACRLKNDKVKHRFPIQKGILEIILNCVKSHFLQLNQPYLTLLYRAVFSTAYYGLFRVSELTNGSHPIQARDVHIGDNKNKMLFILRSSKTHWEDTDPQTVKITSKTTASLHERCKSCPYEILNAYIQVRPAIQYPMEPLFVFSDGSPLTPHNMRQMLNIILNILNLEPELYGTHSFRIGRATDLLEVLKLSVSTIRKIGQWKSSSVYKYLC